VNGVDGALNFSESNIWNGTTGMERRGKIIACVKAQRPNGDIPKGRENRGTRKD
jgi:hypothetical protein